LFHPDEAVTSAIRTVFERFAEFGSARRVWLWFRSEGLSFPLQHAPAGQPGLMAALLSHVRRSAESILKEVCCGLRFM
jgi:hypothetical protein